jgi:small subunit ribosomal protein S4
VNGKVVNIPSYTLKVGDVVAIREKSKSLEVINHSIASTSRSFPWLDWNGDKNEGILIAVPARAEVPENIKEQLIVELYSR